METNETELPPIPAPIPPPAGIVLSPEALSYLRESGKWASFLSILGFIMCGLFLIIAIFISTIFAYMSKLSPGNSAMPQSLGSFISIIYILIDVLYFFFPFYLYRFADRVKKGVIFSDSRSIAEGLSNLKSFFKLSGIVTIVVISIYALIFIAMIIGGIGAAALHR
jgi:hypothetical protein